MFRAYLLLQRFLSLHQVLSNLTIVTLTTTTTTTSKLGQDNGVNDNIKDDDDNDNQESAIDHHIDVEKHLLYMIHREYDKVGNSSQDNRRARRENVHDKRGHSGEYTVKR